MITTHTNNVPEFDHYDALSGKGLAVGVHPYQGKGAGFWDALVGVGKKVYNKTVGNVVDTVTTGVHVAEDLSRGDFKSAAIQGAKFAGRRLVSTALGPAGVILAPMIVDKVAGEIGRATRPKRQEAPSPQVAEMKSLKRVRVDDSVVGAPSVPVPVGSPPKRIRHRRLD
jgi:hypothetical protein